MRGRGLLGKWGPNQAADPIVTRYHPDTNKLQVVAIRRKDTGQWAIPGGMVDDGEAVSATVRREFIEEAGNITGAEARARFETQVHSPQSPPPVLPLMISSKLLHAFPLLPLTLFAPLCSCFAPPCSSLLPPAPP